MATRKTDPEPLSQQLEVNKLDFDTKNPRFPTDIAKGPVDALLERFVRDERLLEIVESIGGQGFFPGEPLLVVQNKKRYTVVEGNRRLAALKLLTGELDVPEGRTSIERACENANYQPSKVQCLVFEKEDQIVRYLGFRHITGIKAWSALQKARYLERLYEKYKDLPRDEGLKILARDTGSKGPYMGQMLTSLALYDRAESKNFYKLGLSPDDIDFSVLSTALSYSAIVDFLGIESRNAAEISKLKEDRLNMLFKWLFLARSNQKSIVGESRNLKKLAAIVTSETAVVELNRNGLLDEAFELSKGPAEALTESLSVLQRRLARALSLVPKVPDMNRAHEDQAEEIEATAATLHAAILNALKRRTTRDKMSKHSGARGKNA